MSYYESMDGLGALGALDAGTTFPAGSEFGVGYRVTGLPSSAAPGALQILRNAVAAGFNGSIVAVQWGPAFGVPTGHLAVKIRTGIPLTGAQLNSIFGNISMPFQAGLRSAGSAGALAVNSHLHRLGGGGGTSADVASILSTIATPGTAPAVTDGTIDPATGLPYATMLPAEEGFFTQSVGGIPMWGLLAGGVLALGAVGYVVMSKPKTSAAVKANRRRRSRRNGRRRAR